MAKGKKKQELSPEELLEQALVPEDEQPYKVPENWVWTRINAINQYVGLSIDPAKHADVTFELYSVPACETGYPEIKFGQEIGSAKQVVSKDDILLCKINPRINRVWIVSQHTENPLVASSEWIVIRNRQLSAKYLMWYFRSHYFREYMLSNVSGVGGSLMRAQPKFVKEYPVPLPPLSEQQRIVDRIENLFAKLDQAKELAHSALEKFEARKAAILHKAFTGELTAKWREENEVESTENRLSKIIMSREAIGSVSKDVLAYIEELNVDDLSDSKGWLHLKTMILCENITCGGTPTGHIFEQGDIPFLKVYNIMNNMITFQEKPQFTNIETHNTKLKSSILKPNDVVMNIVGPPLRKVAIIPNDYTEWNMNQAIVRFRTTDQVLPRYLYHCLIYPATLDEVISETKGVVGQANISITQSRNLKIPVPSLPEQQEIVRILDSFFEKEQKASEVLDVIDKIDLLKKSILSRAFRGELGTNDPADESAAELLKEVLANR